ncbi:hypothetical protein [Streptomyces sp. NPDC047024]|uniref:hypothetical protein n=1 Tax=Streptomyces sp. NPDC047024 TaxID=3155476 RepID=UPI0033F8DB49
MTTTTVPVRFTDAEQRVALRLVRGLRNQQIADELAVCYSRATAVRAQIRKKLGLPSGCSTAVIVAHLLDCLGPRLVPPPTSTVQAPQLDEREHRLLRAITQETRPADIALSAGIPPQGYRSTLAGLLRRVGVDNTTLLVVRAHGWGLLGAHRPSAVAGEADR